MGSTGTRKFRAIAAVLSVVVMAACGTTVNRRGAQAGGGLNGGTGASGEQGGTGGDGASQAGAAGEGSTGGGSGVVSGGTTGAGITGATIGGSSAGGDTNGDVTSSGARRTGITATSMYVGMIYTTNGDALNKAAGANGATSGNEQADGDAVIADINRHGGVAGRKLVPVWFAFDSLSTATVESQYQAACAHFTQDQHVFAVIGQGTAAYRACVQKAGVVQIDDDLPDIAADEFKKYPALVEMGYPNLNRVATEQVASLADQKWFAPWDKNAGQPGATKAKVGIVTYDDPAHAQAVDGYLIPALKQLGYDPGGNVARISPVSTASDYGNQASAVQSAELKFDTSGVDHVIMFESNGGLSLFFMNQAESQHYHPRYGVNTTSGLEVLINAGDVQKDQAVGAMGFGWSPGVDLTADRNPDNGPYANQARRDCLKVMKAAGQTFADTNAEAIALGYCSNLYLLQRALSPTPPVISQATFTAAVNQLGDVYSPAGSLGNFFSAQQHDGVSKVYYWAYFADCTCMHYTGPLRTIP